jgi:NAD(P)-dependent dehydrogenase (short-subunit alcohol dehydrogenase family)
MRQTRTSNKITIVTGANSGIGKMTAIGLAQAGATVVMACRDLARSSTARDEVRTLGGSDRVHLMHLDLASLASIRTFVQEFTHRFDRLDVLVNNAGVASPERKLTADGFELHLGVNHLGPFLLTTLLLPVLERSAPARVIVVAGNTQRSAKINWEDLQSERKYSMMQALGQSKLANLLFVRALAERTRGVTVNALDPGKTATGISRELPVVARQLMGLVFKSPEKGARAPIHLATSPEMAEVTGMYFRNSRQTQPNPIALDDSAAQRLWQISDQLTTTSATTR